MAYFGSDWHEALTEDDRNRTNWAAIVAAAQEWVEARTVCMAPGGVTAESYDRLAHAEAALQKSVKT